MNDEAYPQTIEHVVMRSTHRTGLRQGLVNLYVGLPGRRPGSRLDGA